MKSREDWLCEQLDNGNLNPQLKAQYEAELDKIANQITKQKQRLTELAAERQAKIVELQNLINEGNQHAVVAMYGHEFADNYEISTEGADFVVYSSAAKDFQNNRWPCPSMEEAERKKLQLIYYRVYDYYMRDEG